MNLEVQIWSLLMMVASGGALGAVFDVYRIVAGHVRFGRLLVSAIDLLYWIAATIIVFRVLYITNSGEVRVFVFLGLLLGLSMYYALISTFVIRATRMIIRAVQAVAAWCVRVFQLMVIRPLRWLYRLLMALLGFLAALTVFLYKVVLQLLYPVWMLLRWITRPLHKHAARIWNGRRFAVRFVNRVKKWMGRTK